MSVAALSSYRGRLAGLPEDAFIGSILWFSIAGEVVRDNGKRQVSPVRVSQDTLAKWWTELELDPAFLPPRIKRIDAFRNASSAVERKWNEEDGRVATLYVDEVKFDAEQVVRQVLKRVTDSRREVIEESHVATLKFIRGGRTSKGKRHAGDHVKHAILSKVRGKDHDETESLINEFYERYEDLSTNLQAQAIRGILRSYLKHLNAISMRSSGGLYFVHKNNWPSLDGLQALVKRIGQGCLFDQFPLIESEQSRETVTAAFQAEIVEQTRLLLKKVADVNDQYRGKKIPGKKYAEINEDYQAVALRSAEYSDVVGLALEEAGDALELACQNVYALAARVDDSPTGGRR